MMSSSMRCKTCSKPYTHHTGHICEAKFPLVKIHSGGQTGSDRAALDAAIEQGMPHGGWCPRGRLALDGVIPAKYNLTEHESPFYPPRTARNVQETDGTVIFTKGADISRTAGCRLTSRLCFDLRKPMLHIDLDEYDTVRAVIRMNSWIQVENIKVLNVAGNSEHNAPGIYAQTLDVIKLLCTVAGFKGASK